MNCAVVMRRGQEERSHCTLQPHEGSKATEGTNPQRQRENKWWPDQVGEMNGDDYKWAWAFFGVIDYYDCGESWPDL